MTFQRRITTKKDGAAVSVYLIDNRKVKAEVYEQRLREFNILTRAKNFLVFQGDVANIAGGANNMVLTKLFEQVSGSADLEQRYEELRVAKEKAEEETVLNFQKKKGMDAEKKQFREQEQEAERYIRLQEELRAAKEQQLLFELFFVNHSMGSLADESSVLEARVAASEAKVQEATSAVEAAEKELGKAKRQRLQQEGQFSSKLKEHTKLNPDMIELRKQSEHLTKKIEREREKVTALQRERTTQKDELEVLEQQLFELQQTRKEWDAEVARQQSQNVALDDAQLQQYNTLKEQATRASYQERNQLNELRTAHMMREGELSALLAKEEALTRRRADLEQDRRAVSARLQQQEAFAEETRRKVAELQASKEAAETRRVDALREREQLTEALQTMQEQLRDEKMDRKQAEKEQRFQQTLETLKRLYPGVRGRLMDLAEPRQRKYQVACSVAMGRHMDAIVVDDRQTAVDCLQYMKAQRAGVATFLPLDSIQAKPVVERLRSLSASSKLVCDVLVYEAALEKAILYAVGSTMVCEGDAEAKELCYGREHLKTVTLTGTVYHKSGVVTGGAATSAAKWTRAKLESLKKRRDEHLAQLDRIAHELRTLSNTEDIQAQVVSLAVRLRATEVDVAQCNAKLDTFNQELQVIDKELSKLQPSVATARGDLEHQQKALAVGEKAVRAREDAVFAAFCKKVGVKSVAQFEAEALTVAKQHNEQRLQFSAQEARITSAIGYARSRDMDASKAAMEKTIAELETQLAAVKKKLAAAASKEDALLDQMEALKQTLQQYKDQETEAESKLREARQAKQKLATVAAEAASQLSNLQNSLRSWQSRRHAILRRAAVDEVHLPRVGHEDEDHQEDEEDEEEDGDNNDDDDRNKKRKKGRAAAKKRGAKGKKSREAAEEEVAAFHEPQSSQSQREVFEEEEQVEYDFSSLPKELRAIRAEDDYNKQMSTLQAEISTLSLQVQRMNPNLKAHEKLHEVMEKIGEIEGDLKQARNAGQGVAKQFAEVREERLRLFMECFNHVAERIEQVYDSLTRTRGDRKSSVGALAPLSGKAFLTLQDVHEPWSAGITYQTIPPTKRLWNFDQLSGGEKSLASLALIFAISSYKPSPFFVLDEIDAALDPQNVDKVTRFIQGEAQKSQFIVISLKDSFYSQADALVGVYKDNSGECSRTLSIDLKNRVYDQ